MKGIILLNVGTPIECTKLAIEQTIGDILSDPLVADRYQPMFGFFARHVIAPLSASKSLKKYAQIWRKEHPQISPILYHMQELCKKLSKQKEVPVKIAMRYGAPSIDRAFNSLKEEYNDISEVIIFPLIPHYAQSSIGTVYKEVTEKYDSKEYPFKIKLTPPYYNHPAFINALATHTKSHLTEDFDHLVFSYHSLPIHQVKKAWKKGKDFDYVYQLKETNQLLAKALDIDYNKTLLLYSSQRGKQWLKPFLNKDIADLPKFGWNKIAVIAPGFPIDNLETLYDIDIEARELFTEAGGEVFTYIPSLNAEEYWVDAIWEIISTI